MTVGDGFTLQETMRMTMRSLAITLKMIKKTGGATKVCVLSSSDFALPFVSPVSRAIFSLNQLHLEIFD